MIRSTVSYKWNSASRVCCVIKMRSSGIKPVGIGLDKSQTGDQNWALIPLGIRYFKLRLHVVLKGIVRAKAI